MLVLVPSWRSNHLTKRPAITAKETLNLTEEIGLHFIKHKLKDIGLKVCLISWFRSRKSRDHAIKKIWKKLVITLFQDRLPNIFCGNKRNENPFNRFRCIFEWCSAMTFYNDNAFQQKFCVAREKYKFLFLWVLLRQLNKCNVKNYMWKVII